MDLDQLKIYRITHINNIEHILKNGITHRNSPNHNQYYKTIGDVSLISTRDKKRVLIDNGDFLNYEGETITLGDFIPFYFGVKMPMLFVIQNGGNFVQKATPAPEIIYMACSVSRIINEHSNYYFSDGHATDNMTSFYNKTRINDLVNIINWEAVKAPYWSGPENLIIKRKKQAEFLASEDIPPNFIVGFGCNNDAAKNQLMNFGIDEEKIKVIPRAYY